jgi:hypothetical protein
VPLLLAHRQTTLQLFSHGGILSDKPRGQTRQSDVLNAKAAALCSSGRQLTCGWSGCPWVGIGGGIFRKVELARSVSRCWEVWRGWRFLFHDYFGRNTASRPREIAMLAIDPAVRRGTATSRFFLSLPLSCTWGGIWSWTYALGELFADEVALGLPLPVRCAA